LSQDGKGIGSALDSVDKVNEHLREQLGEALQSVQKSSVPLPDAGTPNLEALKAYALANKNKDTTRDRDSVIGLYQRALELDPQFALAHAGLAGFFAGMGEPEKAQGEWRKALAIPYRLSAQETARVQLLLQQNLEPAVYFQAARQYLALYPDDDQVIARLGTNAWHQLNDFRISEALFRWSLNPAFARQGSRIYNAGIMQLGQDRIPQAIATFNAATAQGFTGAGEFRARAFDALGRPQDSDRIFLASTPGRNGWQGEAGVTTFIHRRQWMQAKETATRWAKEAVASNDVIETVRSQAAIATVAMLSSSRAEAMARRDALVTAVGKDGKRADTIYPPASTELRLYAGLLSAWLGDAPGVTSALQATQVSPAVREYPTVGQLRQVVLAEQERLAGNPGAAVARLAPLAKADTALVCVHWALHRAALDAGDDATAGAQAQWFATHPGRQFAESTTTDVLRFVNAVPFDPARR